MPPAEEWSFKSVDKNTTKLPCTYVNWQNITKVVAFVKTPAHQRQVWNEPINPFRKQKIYSSILWRHINRTRPPGCCFSRRYGHFIKAVNFFIVNLYPRRFDWTKRGLWVVAPKSPDSDFDNVLLKFSTVGLRPEMDALTSWRFHHHHGPDIKLSVSVERSRPEKALLNARCTLFGECYT